MRADSPATTRADVLAIDGTATHEPAVSIIMPVYNAAATIERAIRSVTAQTLRDLEIIACDDGSQDDSIDLLRRLASSDPRLIVIDGDTNRGPAAARNRALAEASGRWVAVLDADDWYAPDRLERLLTIAGETDADLVVDNQVLFDETLRCVVGTALPPGDGVRHLTLDDMLRTGRTGRVTYDYGLLQPVIRRTFLTANGIGYPELYRFGEDFIFALDCLAAGARAVLSLQPMYYVARPHGGLSPAMSRHARSYDGSAMRRSNDRAVERVRGQMTVRQMQSLKDRGHSIELHTRYLVFKDDVRRRPWRLPSLLLDPGLWPYVWRGIERRLKALRSPGHDRAND